jgi:hypothetical protein
MVDRGFDSDAAFFDIVAGQSANPTDRSALKEVAKTYRSLSKNVSPKPLLSRREHWAQRAEECRTLADQFCNPACRAQLRRLAETYDMMVAHCDPVELD